MCSVWIVFAFGDMSGSLSGFVVSCPSRFWFSSSLVNFLSTVALTMPLIAYGLALSVISALIPAVIIVPTSLKLHSKLYSVANLVACLKIDFLPFYDLVHFKCSCKVDSIVCSVVKIVCQSNSCHLVHSVNASQASATDLFW